MDNIFGIGTDIVEISRIKILLNKNKRFKKKIFSKKEVDNCESKSNKTACYSKRFAAKEAFAKALGLGVSKCISFREISIVNKKNGSPYIELLGKTKIISNNLIKKKKIYLSLSDEKNFALAMVVISS